MDAMPEGPDVRMTLNYILDSSKEKYGDLGAVGMAMERPVTYEELHERICALAAGLIAKGLTKGDRVAILAENSHHWGTAYLAVVRLGGVGWDLGEVTQEEEWVTLLKTRSAA